MFYIIKKDGGFMLTELEGSPKQISWALRIRTDKLNRWMKTTPEIFKEIESHLKKETKASWWIAHKDEELGGILKYTKEEGEDQLGRPSWNLKHLLYLHPQSRRHMLLPMTIVESQDTLENLGMLLQVKL
jgi:hypothetical protein